MNALNAKAYREIVSVEVLHMLAICLKSQLMDVPKHEHPAAARQESVQADVDKI